MSNPFDIYTNKFVVFGPADGKSTYRAKVLETRPGWVRFWWPESGGRIGWRNVSNYMIHEVEL